MAMVNHCCTGLTHWELITADQTHTNNTFIRLRGSVDLTFEVLQGLVLGPLLFNLYTTPLRRMISGHAIPHHL